MSSEQYGHFVAQQHRILPSDITITEAIHTFCITACCTDTMYRAVGSTEIKVRQKQLKMEKEKKNSSCFQKRYLRCSTVEKMLVHKRGQYGVLCLSKSDS